MPKTTTADRPELKPVNIGAAAIEQRLREVEGHLGVARLELVSAAEFLQRLVPAPGAAQEEREVVARARRRRR